MNVERVHRPSGGSSINGASAEKGRKDHRNRRRWNMGILPVLFRGRTFKPRLEIASQEHPACSVTDPTYTPNGRLKNVGLSKVGSRANLHPCAPRLFTCSS